MKARLFAIGALALLAACATPGAADAPFDPAACYERDFAVYFDGDSAALSSEARAVIDATATAVRGCRIQHARIIGLAGAIGPEQVNEEISIERARNIADYLVRTWAWPRENLELMATGERGATTDEGLNVPMRRRGRIVVQAVAPTP